MQKRVLLIDDNECFTKQLSEEINKESLFKVVGVANDGQKGVEMIKDLNPDIVIMDIIMPVLDGIGVLEAVNKMNMQDQLTLIVLSAVGMESITQKAVNLGADYYLLKPIEINIVIHRMKQFSFDMPLISESKGQIDDKSLVPSSENVKIEKRIEALVDHIGVPAHVKGYKYTIDAVELVYKDVTYLSRMTKGIYPEIAKRHDTTSSRVERAIRNAIELTVLRGNTEVIDDLFGITLASRNGKIKNSEFISILTNKIKENNKTVGE